MDIRIRKEQPSDYETIKQVNDLAFNQEHEGRLIDNLRKRPEFVPELSLVAEVRGKVVGHILFFPASIISVGEKIETLSLGPMAVHPGFQKKGVGGALVIHGLKLAQELGYKSVVVLGHPEYYPRFGFSPAYMWKIKYSFDAPLEAMMAMELQPGSLEFGGGTVELPGEFFEIL